MSEFNNDDQLDMEHEEYLSYCRELYDKNPSYTNYNIMDDIHQQVSERMEYYESYTENNNYTAYANILNKQRKCCECSLYESENNNLIWFHSKSYCMECYNIKFPEGGDRTDYNELFADLNEYTENQHTESAHMTEDEIYRRFIRDVASGKFKNPEDMILMAKKIKKEIIDDRVCECRWYA